MSLRVRPYQAKPLPKIVVPRPIEKTEEFELFTDRYEEEGIVGWKEPLLIVPGFIFRIPGDSIRGKTFAGLGGVLKTLEQQLEATDTFDPTSYNDTREGFISPMNTPIEMVSKRTGEVVITGYLEYMYDYVKSIIRQYKLEVVWEDNNV